jgi:hypothetical protein
MLRDRFDDAVRLSATFQGDPNRTAATPEETAALNKVLSYPQDHPCPFCLKLSCEHWTGTGWWNPKYHTAPSEPGLVQPGFAAVVLPAPKPNQSKSVWDLVIEDMQARDEFGRKKYGTPLQAGNGRDALVDAYQEVLDLCVYLRQAIEERKGK